MYVTRWVSILNIVDKEGLTEVIFEQRLSSVGWCHEIGRHSICSKL